MKTTTLYHCDRCEFTSEKAADMAAIKLPASMATSGNAERHLCGRCRGELSEWLGDPAPATSERIPHFTHESDEPVGYVDTKPWAVVDQDWNCYGRFASSAEARAARDQEERADMKGEFGYVDLRHPDYAKLRAYLQRKADETA